MKILLLGGTGAMGTHLKDELIQRGDDVFITSRKMRHSSERISYIQGDAHDLAFLQSILNIEWDAIVDFMVYSTEEFKQRLQLLLESTKQYVFISSARVYSNLEIPIKETSPRLLDSVKDETFLSKDEYSLKKAREEDLLNNSGKRNYTIVRPYITYSEKRLQLGDLEHQYWLPRALDGRSIIFSEDIRNHYTTLTYGLDVARGMVALIGNPQAIGEVYHITSDKTIRWEDVLNIYLDAIEKYIGLRPKVKWIPYSMKLNNDALKYQIIYDRTYDRIFDNSKLHKIMPSLSFVDPHEGLTKCVKAFIETEDSRLFSGITEGISDRVTGERIQIIKLKGLKEKLLYILCRFFYFDKVLDKLL